MKKCKHITLTLTKLLRKLACHFLRNVSHFSMQNSTNEGPHHSLLGVPERRSVPAHDAQDTMEQIKGKVCYSVRWKKSHWAAVVLVFTPKMPQD